MNDAHVEGSPFGGPGPDETFRRKLGEGQFEIQECQSCSRFFFYPRAICKYCGSANLHWRRPQSPVTVYATTVVRRKPQDGGDYNVAIVELQEGPRMMSRIEDIAPGDVRIGMAVQPCVRGQGSDAVLVFVPVQPGGTHG